MGGYIGTNGKESGNYYIIIGLRWGELGGYIGIMEKNLETTIMGYTGYILGHDIRLTIGKNDCLLCHITWVGPPPTNSGILGIYEDPKP